MAGALNTKLAKYTCALEWVTDKTSYCESRVYSLLRHSTRMISFSIVSVLHLGFSPFVSSRKQRLRGEAICSGYTIC